MAAFAAMTSFKDEGQAEEVEELGEGEASRDAAGIGEAVRQQADQERRDDGDFFGPGD